MVEMSKVMLGGVKMLNPTSDTYFSNFVSPYLIVKQSLLLSFFHHNIAFSKKYAAQAILDLPYCYYCNT